MTPNVMLATYGTRPNMLVLGTTVLGDDPNRYPRDVSEPHFAEFRTFRNRGKWNKSTVKAIH